MVVAMCSQLSGDARPDCAPLTLYDNYFTKEECLTARKSFFNSRMDDVYSKAIKEDRQIVMVKPWAACFTKSEFESFDKKYGPVKAR